MMTLVSSWMTAVCLCILFVSGFHSNAPIFQQLLNMIIKSANRSGTSSQINSTDTPTDLFSYQCTQKVQYCIHAKVRMTDKPKLTDFLRKLNINSVELPPVNKPYLSSRKTHLDWCWW